MSWTSVQDISSLLGLGGIVVTVLFFIIDSRLRKVMSEFKPNGGASAKDQLDRIEAKIDGHINWHLDKGL